MTSVDPLVPLFAKLVDAVASEVLRRLSEQQREDGLVPLPQVAKRLGRHHQTIRGWIKDGKDGSGRPLSGVRAAGRWFVHSAVLEKYIASLPSSDKHRRRYLKTA